MGKNESTGVE